MQEAFGPYVDHTLYEKNDDLNWHRLTDVVWSMLAGVGLLFFVFLCFFAAGYLSR